MQAALRVLNIPGGLPVLPRKAMRVRRIFILGIWGVNDANGEDTDVGRPFLRCVLFPFQPLFSRKKNLSEAVEMGDLSWIPEKWKSFIFGRTQGDQRHSLINRQRFERTSSKLCVWLKILWQPNVSKQLAWCVYPAVMKNNLT